MKQSSIVMVGLVVSIALGIFSMWFFPLNGVFLAGMVLGTGFSILTGMLAVIVNILAREGN